MVKSRREVLAGIRDTCPPDIFGIILAEGGMKQAARAIGVAASTIRGYATGKTIVKSDVQAKINSFLKEHPSAAPTPAPEPEPAPEIPDWNGKITNYVFKKGNGEKASFKKIPIELVELLKRHNHNLSAAAKSIGYSGWGPIWASVEKKNYGDKFHRRVYSALHGLPLPNGNGRTAKEILAEQPDHFTLGLAICLVALSEYERLEDLAEVLGGHEVFKMTAGSAGWLVVYRIKDRDKLEKFKRLGRRDAKKIACP